MIDKFKSSVKNYSSLSNYSNYLVSDCGRVFNINLNRESKQSSDRDGYKLIGLRRDDGVVKQLKTHRLVMMCFGPPQSQERPEVNHINGIKDDNRIENLEWCSRTENIRHAVRLGLKCSPNGPRKYGRSETLGENYLNMFLSEYESGASIYDLSVKFKVKGSVVREILKEAGVQKLRHRKAAQWKHNEISPKPKYGKDIKSSGDAALTAQLELFA